MNNTYRIKAGFQANPTSIITLKANTPEGEALVAAWNVSFPPPFIHYGINMIPYELFDAKKPQTHFWGVLNDISEKVGKLFGELSNEGSRASNALSDAKCNGVAWLDNQIDQNLPYIELYIYTNPVAARAALARCRNLQFMEDCRIVLVEVELAEIQGPIGSMTA